MNELTLNWDMFLRTVLLISHPLSYAFCLTFGYWYIKRPPFVHALILLVIAMCFNIYLKSYFQVPPLPGLHGWRFPSGHAQTLATFWLWLLWQFPSMGFFIFISTLLALVSIGLVHFNYHLTVDVLAAYLIALFTIIAYQKCLSFLQNRPYSKLIGFCAIISCITVWFIFYTPAWPSHLAKTFTFLVCFILGYLFAPPFTNHQSLFKKLFFFIIGFGGIVILFFSSQQLQHKETTFLVYGLIGLWITWGYPHCMRLYHQRFNASST